MQIKLLLQEEEVKEKVQIMQLVAKELSDPERDCKKFDPGQDVDVDDVDVLRI